MNKRTFLTIKKSLTTKYNIFFVVALLAASIGFQTAMTAVYAADIYVGVSNGGSEDGSEANPYSTIMAAIDHSRARDTVRVAPRVYYENVVMKDGVDLIGADPATTVIDGGGNGSVVETSNDATLSGFTIRNGTGSYHWGWTFYRLGGGVMCDRKNTTIENNVIESNYQKLDTILYGGGIFLASCTATVRNNVIIGNKSRYGSGLYTLFGSPRILNNTFVDNRYQLEWYSQTLLSVSSSAAVENNIFFGNSAGEIWNRGTKTISYNNFWDNRNTPYSYYNTAGKMITYDNDRGDNSVVADPMFVNASDDDYYLTEESPNIDTGNPLYIDPDGTRSDIGAFYFEQFLKPNYVLTSKKANRGSKVSLSIASDRATKEHANENAAFNRKENADYSKVAEADAVLETDGVLVLDRAVKLEPGDYGSGLSETIYLAVILGEYYPIVWVSEDRKSVQISDRNDLESFPEELFEVLTGTELPYFVIEFYQTIEA